MTNFNVDDKNFSLTNITIKSQIGFECISLQPNLLIKLKRKLTRLPRVTLTRLWILI